MKICHICSYFPPFVGGSETHNYSVVKYLYEKGYDVSVIVVRPRIERGLLQKYDENFLLNILNDKIVMLPEIDVEVHNIHSYGLRSLLDIRKEISKIEKKGKVDVFDIHHMAYTFSFSGKKAKILLTLHQHEINCPYMDFPRTFMPDHYTLNPTNAFFSFNKCVLNKGCVNTLNYFKWKMIRSYALKKVMKIMVKKHYLKDILVKTGIENDKIIVIPHWIDVDWIFRNSRDRDMRRSISQIDESDIVFSYFGRLDYDKGPLLPLEALKISSKIIPNAKLVYIGDGPLRGHIEAFSEKYGLNERVILLGRVSHEEIPKYLSLADVFVHTQLYSNYGWALLETMATGKPIIATDVSETSDVLKDGYNALLAKLSPESIASKMVELVSNRKLAKELGFNALKTVKERHSYKNIERYEEFLKECLAQ